MERFTEILSQYKVTDMQAVMASQNASQYCDDDSEEWFETFAATLDCYEEQNSKGA